MLPGSAVTKVTLSEAEILRHTALSMKVVFAGARCAEVSTYLAELETDPFETGFPLIDDPRRLGISRSSRGI